MDQNKKDFDSTNVFLFIIRWWKHLAIICFIAALAGVIFSGPRFITPMFESTVTMFPASTASISRAVLGGPGSQDFLQYGSVEDAERLLQVLGSVAIRERVAGRFNLIEHYGIAPDAKFRRTRLNQTYSDNISSRRTQFGAVEIKVRDKDPIMAADIANEMAALADSVQNEMRYQRALQAYEVAKMNYEVLLAELKLTEDSLRKVMQAGVYDFEGQSTMLTQQLAIDLSTGNQRGVRAIEERLDALSEGGGAYIFLSTNLQVISSNLVALQRRMQEARTDLDNFLNFKFIIDPAFEAERKVYPVRWLILFLATFGAGLMGVVSLMVYENLVSKGIVNEKNLAGKKPE